MCFNGKIDMRWVIGKRLIRHQVNSFLMILLTGFVLFRFFDMVKPWPIGWLDKRVHGGLGIMVDDLVAGVMSATCLGLIGYWAGWLV